LVGFPLTSILQMSFRPTPKITRYNRPSGRPIVDFIGSRANRSRGSRRADPVSSCSSSAHVRAEVMRMTNRRKRLPGRDIGCHRCIVANVRRSLLRAAATVGAGRLRVSRSIVALSRAICCSRMRRSRAAAPIECQGRGISQWIHWRTGRGLVRRSGLSVVRGGVSDAARAAVGPPLFTAPLDAVDSFTERDDGWVVGGTYAVVLYCSSGAALNFASRSTMPTFTDASLIAAAAGPVARGLAVQ